MVEDVEEDWAEGVFSPEGCAALESCGEFFIRQYFVVKLDDRGEMIFPVVKS